MTAAGAALPAQAGRDAASWGRAGFFAVVCGSLLLDLPLFIYQYVAPALLPKFSAVVLGLVALAAGGLAGLVTGRVLALLAAVALYLALCVVALSWTPNADAATQELVTRFNGCGILIISAMVAVATRGVRQRQVLAVLAMLAVLGILLDVAQGYPWTTTPGRAAGTFANPNIAAAGTVILGVLGIRGVPDRWRGIYLGVVAIGVLATLSRGGYAMLALAGITVVRGGLVPGRVLARGVFLLALGGGLIAGVLVRTVLADRPELALLESIDPMVLLRLNSGDATSASEREEVAIAAIELFTEAPLLGGGLTATTAWTLPVSTHNQVLRVAAELGVVGLAALSLLLAAVIIGGRLWRTPDGVAALFWLLVLIVVSHNVLDDWSHLAAIGVLVALDPASDPSATDRSIGEADA